MTLRERTKITVGRWKYALVVILVCFFAIQTAAQKKLSAAEAKDHVGEMATVCGTVASTRYATSTKEQSTFLNLDKAYPNQIFTIVIWGSNRTKFGTPEVDYKGKRICITGKIAEYRGVPEIVADDPKQITMSQAREMVDRVISMNE